MKSRTIWTDDRMTKISVVLPVYNGEKYIKKAIDSVLEQSLTDFELIIINDGSTDSTLDIINGFDDARIRLIDQENLGPGNARNKALDIACGEYVMYLDSDDWLDSTCYEKAVTLMENDSRISLCFWSIYNTICKAHCLNLKKII